MTRTSPTPRARAKSTPRLLLELFSLLVGLSAILVMVVTLAWVLRYGRFYVVTPLGEALPELVLLFSAIPVLSWLIGEKVRALLS